MIYFFSAEQKYRETPLPKIYGAAWGGTSVTTWTRTDDASDFADPNPYYAGMSGTPSSPFDNISPWKDMVTVEDANAGTLVAIPKFYYKLSYANDTEPRGLKIQIANEQLDGFVCSPAHQNRGDGAGERDVVYVGRYHSNSSNYKSATGTSPYVNVERGSARSTLPSLGSNIWQMDFATRFTIWLLYLVEFADWNSQYCIGYGCSSGGIPMTMGYTDNMPYHTGTTAATKTTYGGTQYRNIEGLWDSVFDWIDGCYYNDNGLNIILNPENFSDSSRGTAVGVPSNGYPSAFDIKTVSGAFPLILPTAAHGSDSTYICDYWYFNPSYPCLCGGGDYYQLLDRGLFCIWNTSKYDYGNYIGCRLMKLP